MINGRFHTSHRQRFVRWLLPLLSLSLAIWACSASRSAMPPPVTHLPAAQLRLVIQVTGQYSDSSTVQTQIHIIVANSGQEVSLADKARLTCNGSDVKPTYPNNVIRACPRQPPGGAYRITYIDEHGAQATAVVPVPAGAFAIVSPHDGSSVHIPRDGALAIRFILPIPPPHSSITQFYVSVSCQATPSPTCDSVANSYFVGATPTPLVGVPTATAFANPGPPTPTPNSSRPTATVFENRGPPTPTPPPGSTPTAPYFDGTVTLTGGAGTFALIGDFTHVQPGSGRIKLGIVEQIAPDRGDFAAASATIVGDTTANITWIR